MSLADAERLRNIHTFPSLVKYLRDDLGWPIDSDDFDNLTFDYEPEELGIDPKIAVKIEYIKQLRPLSNHQPFGIFFLHFQPKSLPVVVLRRILRSLVIKKRASANKSDMAAWALNDLLFISAHGEDSQRVINFAHFRQDEYQPGDLPTLHVLGWDDRDTALHLGDVHESLKMNLFWPKDEDDPDQWREQWTAAFSLRHREVITTSKMLAVRLAELARAIRDRVNAVLAVENKKEGHEGLLTKLHIAFRSALIHDLSENGFADMYAQTIAYGLLSARVSRPAGLVAENITDMVPVTNPFLKELLENFLHVGGRKRKGKSGLDFDELGVTDVVETLRAANMEAVLRDFGDKNPQEDPVIHFYELFLKEYDAKKRMQRGVFYTPRPVVSYIVRSVHELLQTEFGLEDGLADTTTWGEMLKKHPGLKLPPLTDQPGETRTISPDEPVVQILDPATGTATFLVEVIDLIHKTMIAKWEKQDHSPLTEIPALWNDYVPKHLLPRLHGYELMMAPYAIAHMKIGLKLYETGYRFDSDERARVYLTNALEPAQDFSDMLAFAIPALAHEAEAVNAVKRAQRFTVVIGNPPYSNFGQLNRIPFVLDLLKDYKKGLNEKKLNLDDDFIKFIRLSQHILEKSNIGLLGMITNNVYIDGITHRRMRESLCDTFAKCRILDLHGSVAKKERCPDGAADFNVFDIQQGVCISLLLRDVSCGTPSTSHRDLWGSREAKYGWLGVGSLNPDGWQNLEPTQPYLFFVPKDFAGLEEYTSAPSLLDCFEVQQNAIKTDRDDLFIDFDQSALRRRIETFFRGDYDDEFRDRYRIEASSSFDIESRRDRTEFDPDNLRTILYRPFDIRAIYYDPKLTSRPAFKVMRHMMGKEKNLALLAMRQVATGETYSHFLVTDTLSDNRTFYSNKGILNVFPLFVRTDDSLFVDEGSQPNFDGAFLRKLADALGLGQEGTNRLPSDVFHYAYAVFHSSSYRRRFEEFLKIEYPRLPLASEIDLFRMLATLGRELIALHLMESPKLDNHITVPAGSGEFQVEKASYSDETVWLDKAKTRGFRGVPEEVWNFHIGGYQVCNKWLKDRGPRKGQPGRTLTPEDIAHYQKIVVALSETIRIMAEIDEVIEAHGGWPDAFKGSDDNGK